jgi:hypothetical protein
MSDLRVRRWASKELLLKVRHVKAVSRTDTEAEATVGAAIQFNLRLKGTAGV